MSWVAKRPAVRFFVSLNILDWPERSSTNPSTNPWMDTVDASNQQDCTFEPHIVPIPSYLYYKWRLSQSLSPASAIACGRFASHCYCCCFVPIFQLFSGHWHVRKWLCICGTKCFWCRGGLGSESESPFPWMLPVVFSPRSGVLKSRFHMLHMHKQKITEANFTDKCRSGSPSPLSGHCIGHTLPQLSQAVDRSQAIRRKHWRGWALGTAICSSGDGDSWNLADWYIDECWWMLMTNYFPSEWAELGFLC